jgi:hypothetical protein
VGYDPFSLCVIHKEGLCPSSGDINRLMMIILISYKLCSDLSRYTVVWRTTSKLSNIILWSADEKIQLIFYDELLTNITLCIEILFVRDFLLINEKDISMCLCSSV